MPKLFVINGPNLNLLGTREVSLYGATTLDEIIADLSRTALTFGAEISAHTSNHEGELIDALHLARGSAGVILNAGAYAHTSLAIADAVRAIAPVSVIEVHITNTSGREAERHRAVVGAACRGRIEGLGARGYQLALAALLDAQESP